MSFVGVDLHTNSFTACRREADGSEAFATFTLSPAELERFCLTLDADDEVAFEATGNSAWFRDQVLPCVGRVVVVNPSQFKVIRQSVKKTDRNDARALALFLAKDMLPETRAKTQAESELGSLTQTRDLLVKQRTRLLNKVHALHNRHGIKLKRESLASRKRLLAIAPDPFTPLEWVELEIVRDQALSLTDAIGNIQDFASADKLAAYFGIVPRVSQSNETDNRGRITKRGSRLARTALVQCTLIATRYSPYLKAYYDRIRLRRGSGKPIIATARKLLAIIYDTLKSGRVFTDFAAFQFQLGHIPAGQSS